MSRMLSIMPNVWAPATDADKVEALEALSPLPSRPIDPEAADAAGLTYSVALEGVTSFGLKAAVDSILKGSLGHGFMPSAPELRIEIDRIMKPYVDRRAERARRQRAYDEAPGDIPARAHGWQDRARALMEKFHKAMDPSAETPEEAAARLREKYENAYGVEALASVPDRKDYDMSWRSPSVKINTSSNRSHRNDDAGRYQEGNGRAP